MSRWGLLLLAVLLAALAGCGSDKDRGKNKGQDRPVSGSKDDK